MSALKELTQPQGDRIERIAQTFEMQAGTRNQDASRLVQADQNLIRTGLGVSSLTPPKFLKYLSLDVTVEARAHFSKYSAIVII